MADRLLQATLPLLHANGLPMGAASECSDTHMPRPRAVAVDWTRITGSASALLTTRHGPLLLHYPCSRIEPHWIPPTQEGPHANSLHPMDRRTEIPRRQPLRARGAVRFRPRVLLHRAGIGASIA